MKDLDLHSYNMDAIFQKCSQRTQMSDNLKNQNVSQQGYSECWNGFVKWSKSQLDQDRTIVIPNFAYLTNQSTNENDKHTFITFLDNFLFQNGLTAKLQSNEVKYPTVKINFSQIQKESSLDKNQVQTCITNIFIELAEIMGNNKNSDIDLGTLGKIHVLNRNVQYSSNNRKMGLIKNKQTVSGLLESSKSLKKLQSMESFRYQNDEQSGVVKHTVQLMNAKSSRNFQSPTRRNQKTEEIHLSSEMLGAGTDPLSKNQNFSNLVSNPSDLLQTSFKKPLNAKSRCPPVLDKFSRTLSRPICSQKFNLSESMRIGGNYNLSAIRLYIDLQSKCIKIAKPADNNITFTANAEYLKIPASMDEELDYVTGKSRNLELEQKIKSKLNCYKRYNQYVDNEINIEYIAPIRQYWITDILDLIPAELPNLTKNFVEKMIDQMLNEINQEYYQSVKQSILNYVLKDQDERLRIGIVEILTKEFKDYGLNVYEGLEADSLWHQSVIESKDKMRENLINYSKGALKVMAIWKHYQQMNIVQLTKKQDSPLSIQQFIKNQDEKIREARIKLCSDWTKEIREIYQEELALINKNKRIAIIIFESFGCLICSQLRFLIYDQLNNYKNFFLQFKKNEYVNATEIVRREKLYDSSIENVFMTLVLTEKENKIEFTDDLQFVKSEILRIITDLVELTHQFKRPETSISKCEKEYLWKIPLDDEIVNDVNETITDVLDENMQMMDEVLQIYGKYDYLFEEKTRLNKFISDPENTIKTYQNQIDKYKLIYNEINADCPQCIRMNMFLVDGLEVKKNYLNICTNLVETLMRAIHSQILKKIAELIREINSLYEGIASKAETEAKLVEIEKNIEKIIKIENKVVIQEFNNICDWLYMLYANSFKCEDELKLIYGLSEQAHQLKVKVEKEAKRIAIDREELEQKLRKRRDQFANNVNQIYTEIDEIKTKFTGAFDEQKANQTISKLVNQYTEYVEEMRDINTKEEQVGWAITEFPKLSEAQANLQVPQKLWALVRNFSQNMQVWTKDKVVFTLNSEEIEQEVKTMFTTANKLSFQLGKNNPNQLKLVTTIIQGISDFKINMPLIKIMCNPGLKDRHWEQISQIIGGKPINASENIKLNTMISMNISSHLDTLEEISETASKEFNIETIMNKQEADWEPLLCEIQDWKDTKTYVITGGSIDEIQTLLDDQMVKTQTMKNSPYAKAFEERIANWEDTLKYIFDMTDQWLKVQQTWLYLEPIFASPDIVKHLAIEAAKFREVDTNWRNIMAKMHQNPKIIEFSQNKKILDIFIECNKNLDIVVKGLKAFMEGKRQAFARFYFLSDDELLSILSETKDPERVQPHLKKCFEGIQKLKFDEKKQIHGMFSEEKEYVQFTKIIDTAAARGQVDEWLVQVEQCMIDCVRYVTGVAYDDYQKIARAKWVLDRCGMAVLCMSMTFWTVESEKYIKEKGVVGAAEYAQKYHKMVLDIVEVVRQPISPLNRCTLEALIVLDVHNRDTLTQLGQEPSIKIQDFNWQSQLRYYWTEGNVQVKIINATMPYNYEYLGNSARLVITALTDRCYRTLVGALYLNYGGAPEGPAGTGKTETVKDLAKALARQCVVFNCSDGMDYKATGKFFKGLASSGAWSCFDEFNRIDLEVLSVVAQQILCINIARTQGLNKFQFEDTMIRLIPTCNCFITMNPGYAGRSELPDNLKVLFRTVAMMVPDYGMISEISLYSFGYKDARNLARKLVTSYKLCSEQLSSQKHYDYGMRAVKSVLSAAGNLKRKYPDADEQINMLRSINDVNLAKFLAFDLPLFKGITSDLFPGVQIPIPDYDDLFKCIGEVMKTRNLTNTDYFQMKVIQLYEMILVRHGLMVVGDPFGAKTSITKVLADSLSLLNERGLMNEQKTNLVYLNPKSISMKLLYGFADPQTNEWTDGLLAVKFRDFCQQETPDRKWLIFDGPVDAIWIENMNTVLDDNRKLCLNSGEIIAMSRTMNMVFEPMDLLVASPATVSRCGMVYMEPEKIGWQPLYQSWKAKLPKTFKPEDFDEIDMLFYWSIDPILYELRHKMSEISPTIDQNLIQGLMRMFLIMIQVLADEDYYSTLDIKIRHNIIDQFFVFCVVWSIGGAVTTEYRKPFDLYLKKLFCGDIKFPAEIKTKKISIPDRGLLFDYQYQMKDNLSDGEWVNWTNSIDKNEAIPKNMQPQEIIVRTMDTVRYSYFVNLNIKNEMPLLFCGPTGTGKSVYIKNVLMSLPAEYISFEVGFSAQTSAQQTQDIIDGRLDRKRKGIFGPKQGKAVLFVDDLNMPAKEAWGAQPPIELLRQYLDQGGWYDNRDKEKPFKRIVDVTFVSAMGPPGGGRTFITPRLAGHCNMISITQFDDEVLNRIFGTILNWFFSNNSFTPEVSKMENKIVMSTLDVYKSVMEDLLPTPMKSHYLFNLRDFSKVIMGICLSHKDQVQSPEHVCRLWVHEVWRVFGDRLVNNEDGLTLLRNVTKTVKTRFGLNFDQVFAHLDKVDQNGNKDGKIDQVDEIKSVLWTDVQTPQGAPIRYYEEILDYVKLQQSCEQSLQNYNQMTDKPMDLVLFNFAIEHMLIIARILKQPGGNGLLVGVGGSGRQSLTRLAASISEQEVMQIEITKTYQKVEWQEDLKKILKQAGAKNIPTVFLFSDTQIVNEGFVEDINNLLNTAEVPNLFPSEEKSEVCEMVRPLARQENKAPQGTIPQLYEFFISQVKKNLHVMLCFSPIGDAFRTRVRMFPSLVNCCTIDWYQAWPQDALSSVARKFILQIDMDNEQVKENIAYMMQIFHKSTSDWADDFFKNLGRKYYVTPTSYLEMIITFKTLLQERRTQVQDLIDKYANGYQKILETESKVDGMKTTLIELQPKLIIAKEETEKKIVIVEKEKAAADIIKEAVGKEAAIVQVEVDQANEIKAEVEADLEKALPVLQKAEKALDVLNPKDIQILKQFQKPPEAIKMALKACCLLLNPNHKEKMKDESGLKMIPDWWTASLKMVSNPDFIKTLKEFDRENIDDKIHANLGLFLHHEDNVELLKQEKVAAASTACESIIMWVNGIYSFHIVNKDIKPKKIKLAEAMGKVQGLEKDLRFKQADLKVAVDKVEMLDKDLQLTIANKNRLEQEYKTCQVQLVRAEQLIQNLGGEKDRWGKLAEELKQFYTKLTGDVLISSGMVAYLGAFTANYRDQISDSWVKSCLQLEIPSSAKFSLIQVLGDQVKIRAWNIDGLPSDTFSIENGIIISKARRWPLLIDPQGQANKWIKKMEQTRKIQIIKLTDQNYLRTLENSIQFGIPVLLENVAETLDPALNPILLKQTYVKGNTTYIKLGDQAVEYNKAFAFYVTTKYRNPHYLPELSTKVTLINFMITYEGLNDQLLGIIVKKERPDLEADKEQLILDGAENKKIMQELEDKILYVLQHAENILDDEEGINVLTASKIKSNEIKEKQIIADQTEKDIDEARSKYQIMSQEASTLFFAISDLANIDPMYQYSLAYYIELFTQAILKSDKAETVPLRLENLRTYFLYSLYMNICRSLFEKDKLLFSFLLTFKILEFQMQLDYASFRFLLTGGVTLDGKYPSKPDNCDTWLSDKSWQELTRLTQYKGLENFHETFRSQIDQWKLVYDSEIPHLAKFPEGNYKPFHKLMILRCIRFDKMVPAVMDFVKEQLGQEFIEPPTFDLAKIFKDSSNVTPLVFILSPGTDPFASLLSLAGTLEKQVFQISLGQGQGPLAQKNITQQCIDGGWVVLQNCHLAVSWMTTLERICEELDPKTVHPDFRLWLTSYPSASFPTAILQNGVKMTNEPPKGLRANIIGSYKKDPIMDNDFYEGCAQPEVFKKLLYGLCFFHAVIQERRKYGPIGWNIPYEFNDSDLIICVKQLKMFLDQDTSRIDYPALNYLTGECNYGGRVTDDKDRRLISTLLLDYYCPEFVSDENYKFVPNDEYIIKESISSRDEFTEKFRSFPTITSPSVFGFHSNADITKDIGESNLLLDSLLICSGASSSSDSSSQDEVLSKIVKTIKSDFPKAFNIEEVMKKYPVDYNQSMNTVLTQELNRFNVLINAVNGSLKDLEKALKGLIMMSQSLDQTARSMFDGKVPQHWLKDSYPSLKPLASYVQNLKERIAFLQKWIDNGIPNDFWVSGFYFTHSFLTGILQNYARKCKIPIDEIVFDYKSINFQITQQPENGAYIYGMFLEGAKWNYETMELDESDPKILFADCPYIFLMPCHSKDVREFPHYSCPIYKTSTRRGVLATTGHSNNFVMYMKLESSKPQNHWIKRGTALLTQLDD